VGARIEALRRHLDGYQDPPIDEATRLSLTPVSAPMGACLSLCFGVAPSPRALTRATSVSAQVWVSAQRREAARAR
jgi:hypothetical protein